MPAVLYKHFLRLIKAGYYVELNPDNDCIGVMPNGDDYLLFKGDKPDRKLESFADLMEYLNIVSIHTIKSSDLYYTVLR